MSKTKSSYSKTQRIPLQASSEVFSNIAIVAHKRSVELKSVFCYPLGILPWSLADAMGTLKKTPKTSLFHKLEGKTDPLELMQDDYDLGWTGLCSAVLLIIYFKQFRLLAKVPRESTLYFMFTKTNQSRMLRGRQSGG